MSRLDRIREAARKDASLRFTNLMHHITVDLLRESYEALKREAAPGVDEVTWHEYGEGLETRLSDLHERVQSGRYRAQPSKRIWLPKPDGRQRPIGIATVEDKVVQQAVKEVLNQIYEEDFLDFSYGFRQERSQHNALDALFEGIMGRKVNWVVDADIRSFFDLIDHDWIMKFLEHRIADRRILRLIRKWLRAGVSEDGEWSRTRVGTPQGAVISPLLANIYLHYALDLWVEQWRNRHAHGDVIIVRFADDFVLGFQYQNEARKFLRELGKRLGKFGLEVHPEKTRLIEFGRFARENRKKRGQGKPETFDFLGFSHICSETRKNGKFTVRRKTIAKRLRTKLKEMRKELMKRRHDPVPIQGKWVRAVVQGYFNYYAVPGNLRVLDVFRTQVIRAWLRALRRRSQRARKLTWDRAKRLFKTWVPSVKTQHPYPNQWLSRLEPEVGAV